MIVYQLVCHRGHSFESWFRNSAAFDALSAAGEIVCPVCESHQVTKALMAPRLAPRSRSGVDRRREEKAGEHQPSAAPSPNSPPTAEAATLPSAAPSPSAPSSATPDNPALVEAVGAVMSALHEIRQKVEAQCDNVGDRFAEEARKIHYGESKTRGIYGHASEQETTALQEEGIEFFTLPLPRLSS